MQWGCTLFTEMATLNQLAVSEIELSESVDANGDLLNKSRSVYANVTSAEHNAIARKLAAQVWNNNLFLPPLF